MYDRAPRALTLTVGCPEPHLGPGCYDLPSSARQLRDGFAPFLSLTSRGLQSISQNAEDDIPGPGHYEIERAQKTIKGGQSLQYKEKRFRDIRTDTPGPGTYCQSPSMGQDISRPKKPVKVPAAQKFSSSIKILRKTEAPSIPSQGQAYGYEELEDGTLIKQNPPSRDSTLGPAYYQMNSGLSEKGKSRSLQRQVVKVMRTEAGHAANRAKEPKKRNEANTGEDIAKNNLRPIDEKAFVAKTADRKRRNQWPELKENETYPTMKYKGVHFGNLTEKRHEFKAHEGPGPGDYDVIPEHVVQYENVNIKREIQKKYDLCVPRYHEVIVLQEEKKWDLCGRDAITGPSSSANSDLLCMGLQGGEINCDRHKSTELAE
ncbi:hypothetical protein JD844_026447 [Phrynosoma platyrhinos]|uniref:Sperm-tail PG-rich repeat-containing protein 2 n=1 Tax=Phrynosoma platyrhinos TaxID=52577 RepID=A0ABQ7SEW8_PHRPL|nr:hypothetical protein JD844_026447 [Phrynosoma platyrhinos]